MVASGEGLYVLKDEFRQTADVAGEENRPQFVVSGEISSIYKKNGKVRKVHNLILLPSLEHAGRIAHRLEAIGNLHSDGRPILGLDSRDLLEIVLELCPTAIFIPAHIWTPHFSLYGAYSGFDDITECFGDLTEYIYALETGLSSDPPMNWRLSALDRFALVSNSDAHSPANLGREANLFTCGLSYPGILQALKNRHDGEFHGTLEFFPEEGKYHYDGHRACKVCWKPAETTAAGGLCPVCGGRITVGVLHRVEALADRPEGSISPAARYFERLSPLPGVIAASTGFSTASLKVRSRYDDLLRNLGPEFTILRETPLPDLERIAGPCITEGIRRLRCGQVEWQPGYDGEYGKLHLMDQQEVERLSGQQCLFADRSAVSDGASGKAVRKNKIPALSAASGQALPIEASLTDDSANHAVQSGYLYGLNEAQWAAVSSQAPAITVVAGPGTGKTKTLICRIAYLVEQCGAAPEEITAVTFTNKAAREMRSRLAGNFDGKWAAKKVNLGTFHSICLQKLSQGRGPCDSLAIIDEYHALSIVEEILRDMGLKGSPREILRGISRAKGGAFPGEEGCRTVPDAVTEAYCERLKQYGVMDYDDILLQSLRDSENEVPDRSCNYLLVDEFQDINETQYRLIRQWSRQSQSVFIIGDPDQSIYGFRGSDFRYFGRFAEDFPSVYPFRLTQNYRSTPEVISSALSLIVQKSSGERTGVLEANRATGAKVRRIEADGYYQESLFVVKEIDRMVGGTDMLKAQTLPHKRGKISAASQLRSFADIAVLYRTNRQAEFLEQCLRQEGIPYVVAGHEDYLSEPPAREALAFFKFLLSPRDMASLMICLKADHGIVSGLREKILADYAAGEKTVSELKKLLHAIQPLSQQTVSLPSFAELLAKYAPAVRTGKPGELIESWIADCSLSEERCMELLHNTAIMHENMMSFIQNLVLGGEGDMIRSGGRAYAPDAISLMTMHAAKGLEFPVVFICGVNDGMIPLRNNISQADIDEERRLFYVGMTRAKDELLLLTSGTPSPFLADLPKEQLVLEQAFEQHASSHIQGNLFGN